MDSETNTTRKDFLKWSGLAVVSGVCLASGYIFGRKAPSPKKEVVASESSVAMPRIRPAHQTIARKSV